MTTASFSTRIRDDSNATYVEWRDEFVAKLTAIGLGVDESNITVGAGSKPSANSEGHYAVFHLNDSLHSSAPVYIRVGFGTGANVNEPRIQITVGTSTNGSGVLGGTALTSARQIMAGGGNQTSDTARQSWFCHVAGFLGIYYKDGAGTAGTGSFFLCRTVDAGGTISATGAMVYWGGGTGSSGTTQALRFAATAVAYTALGVPSGGILGFNPQLRSPSSLGTDIQAFLAWTITPQMSPLVGVCGVLDAELSLSTTFTCTLVGTTPRTYIALAATSGSFDGASPAGARPKFAMLWE